MNIDTIFLHDFLIFTSFFLATYCIASWVFKKYANPYHDSVQLIFSGRAFAIFKMERLSRIEKSYRILNCPVMFSAHPPTLFVISHHTLTVDITVRNEQDLHNTIVCFFPPEDIANLPPLLMQKVIPLLSDRRVAAVMASKLS